MHILMTTPIQVFVTHTQKDQHPILILLLWIDKHQSMPTYNRKLWGSNFSSTLYLPLVSVTNLHQSLPLGAPVFYIKPGI